MLNDLMSWQLRQNNEILRTAVASSRMVGPILSQASNTQLNTSEFFERFRASLAQQYELGISDPIRRIREALKQISSNRIYETPEHLMTPNDIIAVLAHINSSNSNQENGILPYRRELCREIDNIVDQTKITSQLVGLTGVCYDEGECIER